MLQISGLTYRIAGREILHGATVQIPADHKVGVVGRNGVGKSTLLRLIMGEITPDLGEIQLPRGWRVGMVAQEAPGGERNLLDTVLAADTERQALLREAESATAPERIAEIQQRLVDIDAHSAPARAGRILAGLGFTESEQQRPCAAFSGGWRMRVALAALLFSEPDILLLDEPTNYLDLEGVLWLEGFLRRYRRTALLVSHDRDLLNRAVGSILHVENGGLTLYRGGYDDFERTRREKLALQEKAREKQETQRRHMQAFVDRFRYKASKARQAQSRLKALARMEPIAAALEDETVTFRLPEPAPLASPILSLDDAAVGYEPGRPVLRHVTLRIDADDRIAMLGRNGNGKSTLAKLLAGRLQHEAGERRASRKLRVGFFGQHQIEVLEPSRTAYQHLQAALPNVTEPKVRARLGGFGLSQVKADTAAQDLSGGERARLVLALITVEAPQLLILDEPTNHLDVDAREALAQALNDYAGAVLLISHDRHLVDLVADRLWLVADGRVRGFDGDIDDYRKLLLSDRGDDGERPEARPSRRSLRQEAARQRERMAALRKAVKEAERRMQRLAAERDSVRLRLANPGLYAQRPDEAQALARREGELARQLEAAEAAWLEASEMLESSAGHAAGS